MNILSSLLAKADASIAKLLTPARMAMTPEDAVSAIQSVAKRFNVDCKISRSGEGGRKLRVEMQTKGPTPLDSIEFVVMTEADPKESGDWGPVRPGEGRG